MANNRNKNAFSKLEQIADLLGLPVEAFLNQADEPLDAALVAQQEDELLRLFRAIRDGGLRQRLLAYVRAAADRAVA